MALLDALAFLACLVGGAWTWRQLHRIGITGLPAAFLTLVALSFVGSLLASLYVMLLGLWTFLLALARDLLGLLIVLLPILLLCLVWYLWWTHRRARQFFDR